MWVTCQEHRRDCEVVDERLDGEDERELVVGRQEPDEVVDDEEDGQREVDLDGDGVLPVDARLLLEVVRVWKEKKY